MPTDTRTHIHPHIHPPHQEIWDGVSGTMRNRGGDIRRLDAHSITEFGFYGQRMFHRPASRAVGQRMWLLPALGLRVISWIKRPGAKDVEDYYIDIAAITANGGLFHMTDYYLDIRVWEGKRAELIDNDEFIAAITAGHLDADQAQQAMADAYRAVDGIARHGYRLASWLSEDHDIDLTWPSVLPSANTSIVVEREVALSDSAPSTVTDRQSRPLGSLRISVTDRCNLRCRYCMPEDEYTWLSRNDILSFDEVTVLARVFTSLGVNRVRITGGEPLLRPRLSELVEQLSDEPGIADLALTTNGVLLARQVNALHRAGLNRVTVSLDTLKSPRFERLSRRGALAPVLEGVDEASARFGGLKLDTVVMRGFNNDELVDLIEYAKPRNAEVRFIEYMDVGGATHWTADQVYSRAEMLDDLTEHYGRVRALPKHDAAPADRFALPDGTVFGIISSTTQPFCAACDRSRLTADGMWLRCLYAQSGTDLRRLLRQGAGHRDLVELVRRTWRARNDQGAVDRLSSKRREVFVGIDSLRRNPHLEMHTRGG